MKKKTIIKKKLNKNCDLKKINIANFQNLATPDRN